MKALFLKFWTMLKSVASGLFTSLRLGALGVAWDCVSASISGILSAVIGVLPAGVTQNRYLAAVGRFLAWSWDWVVWTLKAVWRSFWTVWKTPMAYPIMAVIALVCFTTGHSTGRRGYRELAGAYQSVFNSNVTLQDQIKALRAANTVVVSVPPASAPVAAKVSKPIKHFKPAVRRKASAPAPKPTAGFFGL